MKINKIILLAMLLVSISTANALTAEMEGNISIGNNYLLWSDVDLYRSLADTLKTNDVFISTNFPTGTYADQDLRKSAAPQFLGVYLNRTVSRAFVRLESADNSGGNAHDYASFNLRNDFAEPDVILSIYDYSAAAFKNTFKHQYLDKTIDFFANAFVNVGNITLNWDVNLYRPAANILKTDDSLTVAQKLAVGGNGLDGLTTGDINVSTVYYDSLSPKSPILFESDTPEPICVKADNNKYVACMPKFIDNKYEWVCEENPVCNEKVNKLEAYRTEQRELDRLQKECESQQETGEIFLFNRKTEQCVEKIIPIEEFS